MKKMALAAAAASLMICGSALAQDGTVYSVNVVGFQKVQSDDTSAPAKRFTLASNPFNAATNDINGVVGDQLTGFFSSLNSDKIYTFNGTTYSTFWKRSSDGIWRSAQTGGTGPAATEPIGPGVGFWIEDNHSTTQEVVFVGEVVDVPAITNVVAEGFSLVAYPYSSDMTINESGLTNGYSFFSSLNADKIFRFDADAQAYSSYWLRTSDKQFIKQGESTPTTDVIPTGEAFWFQHRAGQPSFNWVETIPYDLDS